MNKILLILTMLSLLSPGCAGSVAKSFKVKIDCTNCKTPYGSGDKVDIFIERDIEVKNKG